MRATLSLLATAAAVAAQDPVGPTLPWGIHLAQGSDAETEMTLMWSTRAAVGGSVVTLNGKVAVSGESYEFTDVGNTQFIHRVRLSGLSPATRYSYTVGDGANATSPAFSFATPPYDHVPTLAVYGDMGISSNALSTMPLLIADAAAGMLDVIVHIGDIAYNLQDDNGARGDAFMNQIQPLSSIVPCACAEACPRSCLMTRRAARGSEPAQ